MNNELDICFTIIFHIHVINKNMPVEIQSTLAITNPRYNEYLDITYEFSGTENH